LAAGALGSPKTLLQSRDNGLLLSPALGSRFGGNGDFFGLAYNSNQVTDILGWGNHRKDPSAQVVRAGPSIVGLVRYNDKAPPTGASSLKIFPSREVIGTLPLWPFVSCRALSQATRTPLRRRNDSITMLSVPIQRVH